MANIAITGGCGFIGSNLVKHLAGDNRLVVVDNFSRGDQAFIDSTLGVEIIQGDIRDEILMRKALKGCDAVIHLAAYGSVVESVSDPMENFSVNVCGTFSVLEAARFVGIRRLVFASTGGALIGNTDPPVNEQSLPRPISPYGASKLAGEGYCCSFASSYDMDVTVLRFANVVGPVSWHKKGAITGFFKAILEGQPIRIYGDGSATRDFLYVADLCEGISAALRSSLKGYNVFHLASGREVSIRELAELVRHVTGRHNHPVVFEGKRKGEVERNFAAYDLAREKLGFVPTRTLEEGLRETWKWVLERSGKRALADC